MRRESGEISPLFSFSAAFFPFQDFLSVLDSFRQDRRIFSGILQVSKAIREKKTSTALAVLVSLFWERDAYLWSTLYMCLMSSSTLLE